MIKLIAADMDGTLLDSQKRVPAELEQVVRALWAKGIRFVIASGRQAASLMRDMGNIADELTYIAENGAVIIDQGRQIYVDSMDMADVRRVLENTRGEKGMHPVLCCPDRAVIEESAPLEFRRNVKMYYESTQIVPDLLKELENIEAVCKMAFYDEGDAEHHEYPILDRLFSGDLAVILSSYSWVDIMKPGAHKGRGMRTLQGLLGVAPDECMAFGDYFNDMELLESVGESYAMDNALPEVKAVARYVAPSNDENGVMRVVKERFGL